MLELQPQQDNMKTNQSIENFTAKQLRQEYSDDPLKEKVDDFDGIQNFKLKPLH